ncbi:MAG TPA: tetratricopeptide repeat protein [Longimicrobiales bacterium]|nr:tetratricopeptide repeat protein [Longimicrobiales bacterium]
MHAATGSRRPWVLPVVVAIALTSVTAVLLGLFARAGARAGADPPGVVAFVGSEICAGCHAPEYDAWRGSHHDLAMQEADAASVLGDFDGATFDYGEVTSRFFRDGDRFFVETDGPDGAIDTFQVRYTFGVEPLQQYLIELDGGRLQPLSIAWDSRPAEDGGQRWFHLYPGDSIHAGDPLHWTGRAQNWNHTCADCHSTSLSKNYDSVEDRFRTTWAEIDVGCEACHGPGAPHVEWARSPTVLRAMIWRDPRLAAPLSGRRGVMWTMNPETGTAVRSHPRSDDGEIAVCAQCHSLRSQIADGYAAGADLHDYYVPSGLVLGFFHADGQQREEVYTWASFLHSRMYAAGVTCSDCHDPHSQQPRLPGNQLCGQCHEPARFDLPDHHRHPVGSTGAQCVACHMPPTTYMLVDDRRDHRIAVPRPDLSVAIGTPNACTGCHTDRSAEWAAQAVRDWLGRDAAGFQRFATAFAAHDAGENVQAALRDIAVDATQPAVVRAGALARLAERPGGGAEALGAAGVALGDPDPVVRHSALAILESLPPAERVARGAPLLEDPARSVRIEAARVLAPALGRAPTPAFTRAAQEYIESLRYNADQPGSRVNLAVFLDHLGRTNEALSEYMAVIDLAPEYVPAYVNLAEAYRLAGAEEMAEATLRAGIERSPESAPLHHALGLSLVRSGRAAEALVELERAAELAPDNAYITYVYAVALHDGGRRADAIRVLEEARILHPNDPELIFALATFHRDAGDTAAAMRYTELLIQVAPGDPRGPALRQELR